MKENLKKQKGRISFFGGYRFSFLVLLFLVISYAGGVRMVNISFFIRQMSLMVFLTIGVSIEYISGDFDLAFAAQISTASLLCAFMLQKGVPVILSCSAVFVFNGILGCLKGFMTMRLQMPSIIVTLALQIILTNFCAGITQNNSIVLTGWKNGLGRLSLSVIGVMLTAMGIAAAFYFFEKTYYGKYAKMLGENPNLVRENGMDCVRISMLIHVWASLFLSVPAIIIILYTGSGSSSLGSSYLYKVLTAVFLGRIFFRDEKRFVPGMLLGALTVVLVDSMLTASGYLNKWEAIIEGIIILVALWVGDNKKN